MESSEHDLRALIKAHLGRHEQDLEYMIQSIEEAQKSAKANKTLVEPRVGAVVVTTAGKEFRAHRSQVNKSDHAEFTLFSQYVKEEDLHGATLFTTLEPCTTRNHPKTPCASWIEKRGISKVFVGILDPNPDIFGRGIRHLQDHGIEVELYPGFLQFQIRQLNDEFIQSFDDNHLRLVSYACPATYRDASCLYSNKLAQLLWGDPHNDFDMQRFRIEKARETGRHDALLRKLEELVPASLRTVSGDQAWMNPPVALQEVYVTTAVKFRNTSFVPLEIAFSESTGELKGAQDGTSAAGNVQLRYRVRPTTQKALLSPKEEKIIDADVALGVAISSETGCDGHAYACAALEGGDRLRRMIAGVSDDPSEISGLTMRVEFYDGTTQMREFGIRMSNLIALPRLECPLDAEQIKAWAAMEKDTF